MTGATDDEELRWRVFTVLLAVAACFHVLGNAVFADPSGIAVLAAGAAAVLLVPGRRLAFALLAAGIALTAWQEAPLLGNHWALAGFVAVGAALAGIGPVGATGARALPVVRCCYLGFYAFAAFSKLNHDFLDASVTCAGEYLGATADAIGLGGLDLEDRTAFRGVAAVTAAIVECAVPILLLARRTRTAGVVLAVAFHVVVALPRGHQFFDFSAVLLAGWSAFLPAAFHRRLAGALRGRVPLVHRRVLGTALVAVVGILGAASADGRGPTRAELVDVGWWVWQPFSLAALVVVGVFVWRHRSGADLRLRPAIGWRAVVPLLVVANGVAPYLELKTSTAWNMYANLRTAGGESNHLLIRRTFPLTSPQDDLVTVVDSDDPALATYEAQGFVLPVRTLRAYLQDHPATSATLLVGDEEVEVVAGGPLPDRLGPPVPAWVERLFVLRAVDASDPERCQTSFLPAR